jgi:hypothetical protein
MVLTSLLTLTTVNSARGTWDANYTFGFSELPSRVKT